MVFSSSVPVFLDPPNWPQQQNHHHGQANNGKHITGHEIFHQHHHQLPPLPPNPNTNHQASAGTPGGLSARSGGGSMSDRARLAKLPQPEGSLKCPRCESTNTKFCYFNNYSLSQPRHFCKTCRRYWTRGGALRSVPVGGGCRRNNKKGKNGKQKSNGQVNKQTTTSGVIMSESMGNDQINQTNPNFPFLASLQNLSQFGNIGLNLGGISSNENLNPSAAVNQFAFFDPTNIGLYQFHGDGNGNIASASATGRVSQIAPVKMEENRLLNLSSRPISGFTSAENNNNPFWVGAPDFSGLNNSLANNQVL